MQSDDTQETLVRSTPSQPALTPLALDDQLAFLLRRSHQHLTSLFQQMMTVSQLTSPQYNALLRLREQGRVSQNQLGRLIDMDPATTQGVVTRLVQRGLIERVPDEVDRRRVQLTLTESGHQTMLEALVVGQDIQERALADFSEQERAELLRLLGKLTR